MSLQSKLALRRQSTNSPTDSSCGDPTSELPFAEIDIGLAGTASRRAGATNRSRSRPPKRQQCANSRDMRRPRSARPNVHGEPRASASAVLLDVASIQDLAARSKFQTSQLVLSKVPSVPHNSLRCARTDRQFAKRTNFNLRESALRIDARMKHHDWGSSEQSAVEKLLHESFNHYLGDGKVREQ